MRGGLVLLLLALLSSSRAFAAEVTPYFRSSAGQSPRSNAGLSVESDRVRMHADIKVLAPDDRTEIVPQLSSSFAISDRVGVETRIDLAEWNASDDLGQASFNTRLHVRSLAPFLDELEGVVWRSPDGQSRQILKFGFYQILRSAGFTAPLTLRAKATVESIIGAGSGDAGVAPQTRRVGFEAVLGGLLPEVGLGESSLRLKMERTSGEATASHSSVAYDYAWMVRPASRFGLNFKLGREPATLYEVVPTLGLSWRTQF